MVGETGAPGENPRRHRENMQTPHRKVLPQLGIKPRTFSLWGITRRCCEHPLECTTSRQSRPTWSIIINIDWYETSLSCYIFSCIAQAYFKADTQGFCVWTMQQFITEQDTTLKHPINFQNKTFHVDANISLNSMNKTSVCVERGLKSTD